MLIKSNNLLKPKHLLVFTVSLSMSLISLLMILSFDSHAADVSSLYNPQLKNFTALEDMVPVPAGDFFMGTNEGEPDEWPRHQVYLSTYYIGRYEVTNYSFASFAKQTGYRTEAEKIGFSWVWVGNNLKTINGASWRHPAGPDSTIEGKWDHPAVHITWYDAKAYCRWKSKKTGNLHRLPTEAEWERAARGGVTDIIYPWGEKWDKDKANCWEQKIFETSRAGRFDANGYQLFDMAGNVWEWCEDSYSPTYYKSSSSSNPNGPQSTAYEFKVMRGGAFRGGDSFLRCAARSYQEPNYMSSSIGFRVIMVTKDEAGRERFQPERVKEEPLPPPPEESAGYVPMTPESTPYKARPSTSSTTTIIPMARSYKKATTTSLPAPRSYGKVTTTSSVPKPISMSKEPPGRLMNFDNISISDKWENEQLSLEISLGRSLSAKRRVFTMKEPARIVIDIYVISRESDVLVFELKGNPLIKQIRFAGHDDYVRFVLDAKTFRIPKYDITQEQDILKVKITRP